MHRLVERNNEFWNHDRSLTALLVYMCLAVLVWIPLGDYAEKWWAFLLNDLLFNLIILAGVFAVFIQWRKQFVFIIVALLAGVLHLLAFLHPYREFLVVSHLVAFIFFSLLARQVLARIFKQGPMNFYRIQGSVVVFLIIGILFALLYTIVEVLLPGSFAITEGGRPIKNIFSQLLYFSFTTITTLGIGDMVPVASLAKALVVVQGMVGLLYPVIMIARLVSLEVSHSAQERKTEE